MAKGEENESKVGVPDKGKGKEVDPKTSNVNHDQGFKEHQDGTMKSQDKDKDKPDEDELSEEDQQLKEELDMLVERLLEPKTELYAAALEKIKDTIRSSTSSMTAVPKPLKFLRPHYASLESAYAEWATNQLEVPDDRRRLADVLSVLGMTYSDEERLDTLKYRILADQQKGEQQAQDLSGWGHEYVRHLSLEIGTAHQRLLNGEKVDIEGIQDDMLIQLAFTLVPFFLKHNADGDAVDILTELEEIDQLPRFLDENIYERVCLYIVSMVPLLTFPDNDTFLRTAHAIYRKYDRPTQALTMAIRLDDHELIKQDLDSTCDSSLKRQMAMQIARQRIVLDLGEDVDDTALTESLTNVRLHEHFKNMGKELNILDPKSIQDIYKTHLESSRTAGVTNVDSARQNLASAFVNGFVNAGFGNDNMMLVQEDESKTQKSWIWKTKDDGKISTAASTGLLQQWDVDQGLQTIDAYMRSDDDKVRAGAVLAVGILNSGVRDPTEPAMALLSDSDVLNHKSKDVRLCGIIGLGLAYAGAQKEDMLEVLLPYVADTSLDMQVSAMAALSLGLVFVGSANSDISESIVQTFFDEDRAGQLKDKWTRFMALGLALLYFGRQEEVDVICETLQAVDHPMSKPSSVLCQVCAWAGTGTVLKIQELLHICNEHVSEEPSASITTGNHGENSDENVDNEAEAAKKKQEAEDAGLLQSYAVLGLSLVAMGEDIGTDMILRQFGHLMHYGEPNIRRAVPLAMSLISPSNPQMKIYDTLSRYTHDNDNDVAINSILAMGIVGAGTNNARLAQLLRQLASYYSREPNSLFMVRVAQALLHMAKGTMSLNPYHTDRSVLSRVGAASLLTVLLAAIDSRSFILADAHYLLYILAPAMNPRMLVTLNEDLAPLKVNVRVGQAVDTVGQAGKPRSITGWQTQSTPVVLAYGERAELEDEKYLSLSNVLEGVVILKKNPDWEE